MSTPARLHTWSEPCHCTSEAHEIHFYALIRVSDGANRASGAHHGDEGDQPTRSRDDAIAWSVGHHGLDVVETVNERPPEP